ncbi:MAG TPA: calcium/proton exchanger [Anaeromyxobacteraceae bacterium]|nr:calcium/proton exchanger [Anaeromyxobacteraceae bacterium]
MKLPRLSPLDALLVCVPATLAARWIWPDRPVLSFASSCLAVVPLAGLMGRATEALAARVGTAVGGFLSATVGNAAELILGLAALRAGELAVVKASITGAIVGNLLLVFGAAAFAGGLRREKQTFNATAAGAGVATLFLASVALLVPALLHHGADPHPEKRVPFSVAISLVLLATYALSLRFSLGTHAHLYDVEVDEAAAGVSGPRWSVRRALGVLVGATVAVAVMSEILVGSIEGAAHALGLSRVFVGVVVVAIVGNAAEHSTAVLMALRDRMDLALHIAVESSKQVALLVAPALVLAGLALGRPMDLVFTPLEVVAVGAATGAITLVALDGESNWLEGAMLVAVYAVLGVAFYFA